MRLVSPVSPGPPCSSLALGLCPAGHLWCLRRGTRNGKPLVYPGPCLGLLKPEVRRSWPKLAQALPHWHPHLSCPPPCSSKNPLILDSQRGAYALLNSDPDRLGPLQVRREGKKGLGFQGHLVYILKGSFEKGGEACRTFVIVPFPFVP